MFKNLSLAALGISGQGNEAIELALSSGFKSIDLNLEEFSQQVQLHGMARGRRLLDSAKLTFGTFSLPSGWEGDETQFKLETERLKPLLELAQELGAKRALLTMPPASDERPYHQNFEFHRRRFAELGALLAPYQIRLGVGYLAGTKHREGTSFEFIHSLEALQMLLGMTGSDHVGVLLDLWQLHISGGGIENIRKLSARQIVAVQVADAQAESSAETSREEERLLPGETGVIDVPATLTALAEMGYDGPVTAVPHPSRFKNQRRDQIVKQTGEALDRAWKDAGLLPAGKLSSTVNR